MSQTCAVKNVDTIRSSVGCCNNAITVLLAILTYMYIHCIGLSGIGIELGNLSGHRTLVTFCKLIANYMYIAHKMS